MVRIYKTKVNKNSSVGEGWVYWGEFKSQEEEKHVWYKEVSKEEAEQYELENGILD